DGEGGDVDRPVVPGKLAAVGLQQLGQERDVEAGVRADDDGAFEGFLDVEQCRGERQLHRQDTGREDFDGVPVVGDGEPLVEASDFEGFGVGGGEVGADLP